MKIGQFEVDVLIEGTMKIDGGSAFGIVPKPLWEKKASPDEKNRVKLGLRQLLIRSRNANILIDTGIGQKVSKRFREIFAIEYFSNWIDRLKPFGLSPKDITHVFFTHLHFDHSGGATFAVADGSEIVPTFPNADHILQSGEWNEACVPNERTRASYFFEDFLPLQNEGKLRLVSGDQEILEGIRVRISGGHTRFHQIIIIEGGNSQVVCPGDIFPTSLHLHTAWESAFDQFPQDTLECKKILLSKYLNAEALFFFGHDLEDGLKRLIGTMEKPVAVSCE
ncbi:MAG: MBL fold metallo-hydrolase [Candidatus Riflebacteria bacterium]|nr:MBL fold metallo-hydrolase [Candidatus Riflebacteria bacterium]